MLVFIVIIAISAIVAYFVINSKKKDVKHVEDIKVQSTVLPVEEKIEPIAKVQKAEPKKKAVKKASAPVKKSAKKAK